MFDTPSFYVVRKVNSHSLLICLNIQNGKMTISVGKLKGLTEGHLSLFVGGLEMTKILCQIHLSSEHATFFFYLMSTVNRLPSNEVMSYEESKT